MSLEKGENVNEKFKRKGEQIEVSTHWRSADGCARLGFYFLAIFTGGNVCSISRRSWRLELTLGFDDTSRASGFLRKLSSMLYLDDYL
jgi:hypothetical protein